jgi:hypothetical protein
MPGDLHGYVNLANAHVAVQGIGETDEKANMEATSESSSKAVLAAKTI